MSEACGGDLRLAEEIMWSIDCFGADFKCDACDTREECVEEFERVAKIIAADRAREREANARALRVMANLLREFAVLREFAEGSGNGNQA